MQGNTSPFDCHPWFWRGLYSIPSCEVDWIGLIDWFSGRAVLLLVFFSFFFHPVSQIVLFFIQLGSEIGKAAEMSNILMQWRKSCWLCEVEEWVVPVEKLISILLYAGLLESFLLERSIVLLSPFWEGNLTFTMQDWPSTSTPHQAFESFPAKFMLFNPSVNCVAISVIHFALDLLEGKWLSRFHIFISKTPLPKRRAFQWAVCT